MNKPRTLTNQQLLEELEQRLPNFSKDELMILSKLTIMNNPYREETLQFLESTHPETHNLLQEAIKKIDKEKIDEQIKEIKKLLVKDKSKDL
jgi:hypothetical protein